MCRNIKTLFNFDPPVTLEEIQAASLQFVRKITGFNKPSQANEAAFFAAVEEVAAISTRLLRSLETNAPPKNREEEAAKAKMRAAERFGGGTGNCWRDAGALQCSALEPEPDERPAVRPWHEADGASSGGGRGALSEPGGP